jgi:hypothetical protein
MELPVASRPIGGAFGHKKTTHMGGYFDQINY